MSHGCHAPRRSLAPALLIALAGLAFAKGASATAAEASLSTEATTTEGYAGLVVRVFAGGNELKSSYGGALVSVNRSSVGYAPWTNEAMRPGSYVIGVEADNYYPVETTVGLQEKTRSTLTFALRRMSGFLDARLTPEDSELLIDGKIMGSGLLELPTGRHHALVRRFAYRERGVDFTIQDKAVTTLDVSLDEAPFEVSELRSRRAAFDPGNVGALGATVLSFSVTSYGSATLEILSAAQEVVARFDFPLFTEWKQSVSWPGRSMDPPGAALPDGKYLVRLSALPSTATASTAPATGPVVLETTVAIDSGLAVSPYGAAGAMPGLLLFPEPGAIAFGLVALDLGISAESTVMSDPSLGAVLDLGMSASLGRFGFALASFVSTSTRTGSADSAQNIGAAISLRWAFSGRASNSPGVGSAAASPGGDEGGMLPAFGVFLKASYSGSAAAASILASGTVSGAMCMELGLPAALASRGLSLGLAPALLVAFPVDGLAATVAPLIRGGIWYSTRRLRLGCSAMANAASLGAMLEGPWSWAAAAECRAILGASPLVFSVACTARKGAASPVLGASLGLGYML